MFKDCRKFWSLLCLGTFIAAYYLFLVGSCDVAVREMAVDCNINSITAYNITICLLFMSSLIAY